MLVSLVKTGLYESVKNQNSCFNVKELCGHGIDLGYLPLLILNLSHGIVKVGEEKFNRGALMNIGFTEALKVRNFTCVIFHDVDLLPLDTRNDYGCPSSPRHMSPAVDTKQFT